MDLGLTAQIIATATGSNINAATQFLPLFQDAFPRYDITTTARVAAFLSQVGHESGGLKWLEEIWGPDAAQLAYERIPAAAWPPTPNDQRNHTAWNLGNSQPGDSWRFRGRGLLQLTGRTNYRTEGLMLGQDFEGSPDMVSEPKWATETSCMYWLKHGCNDQADQGQIETITRLINGGLSGFAERLALFNEAMDAMSDLA
jgi:putative chitinase